MPQSSLLTGFYLNDKSDKSADVEKNLRDFGNYVTSLNEKDSILDVALRSFDNYMLMNKALQARKTELAQLKSIRDQLLISGMQLSGLIGDQALCKNLLSYSLSSQPGLCLLLGAPQAASRLSVNLSAINNQASVGSFMNSQASLGSLMNSKEKLNMMNVSEWINSKAVNCLVYDKERLQFNCMGSQSLQKVLSSQQMNALFNGVSQLNLFGVAMSLRGQLKHCQLHFRSEEFDPGKRASIRT